MLSRCIIDDSRSLIVTLDFRVTLHLRSSYIYSIGHQRHKLYRPLHEVRMHCFRNALTFFTTAVSYMRKMLMKSTPGIKVIKLFKDVIYKCSLQARMFFRCIPFLSKPIFVGKARNLNQSGVPESCFTWVGASLPGKHQIRLDVQARLFDRGKPFQPSKMFISKLFLG